MTNEETGRERPQIFNVEDIYVCKKAQAKDGFNIYTSKYFEEKHLAARRELNKRQDERNLLAAKRLRDYRCFRDRAN